VQKDSLLELFKNERPGGIVVAAIDLEKVNEVVPRGENDFDVIAVNRILKFEIDPEGEGHENLEYWIHGIKMWVDYFRKKSPAFKALAKASRHRSMEVKFQISPKLMPVPRRNSDNNQARLPTSTESILPPRLVSDSKIDEAEETSSFGSGSPHSPENKDDLNIDDQWSTSSSNSVTPRLDAQQQPEELAKQLAGRPVFKLTKSAPNILSTIGPEETMPEPIMLHKSSQMSVLRFSDASGTTYSRTSAFSYDNDELLNVIKAKNEEIQLKTQQVRELQEQLAILKEQVDNQASVNQQVITDKKERQLWRIIKDGDEEELNQFFYDPDCLKRSKAMLDKCIQLTPLHLAVSEGNARLTKTLIDRGSNVNKTDNLGRTALLLAIETHQGKKSLELVQILLKGGADPNKGDCSEDEFTPLHAACLSGNLDNVKLLLSSGASGTKRDGRLKWTPLHWAVVGGNPQVVQTLLTLNIPLLSVNGKSPLDLAKDEEHYNPQVVNMLISHTLHMNRTRGNTMTIQMN
jgi:ankyrin repeat protein